MTGTVFQIGPFPEQKILSFIGAVKGERPFVLSRDNSTLNESQFQVQDVTQLFGVETAKDEHFVDSVHEFGRESALRGIDGNSLNFAIHFLHMVPHSLGSEPDAAGSQSAHLVGTEIGSHENNRS